MNVLLALTGRLVRMVPAIWNSSETARRAFVDPVFSNFQQMFIFCSNISKNTCDQIMLALS